MNKQLSLSALADELAQAKTRKKEFLEQMNVIIPWNEWIGVIQPYYYKGELGNKPFPLETMLRIHMLQNLYDLSDMGAKYEVLILKKGTIVDSTIIAAPPSTKNREKKRDPDACQAKKGNTWHFGYKAHIGMDQDTGLVHHLEVTAANVHDVTVTPKLLTGEEKNICGDSGYLGAGKREDAVTHNNEGKKIRYKINHRPSQSKSNSVRSQGQVKRREREKSSVRAKVKHVFGVVKGLFGYLKTRYKGRRKQTSKLHMMFALANLHLADKRCLTA